MSIIAISTAILLVALVMVYYIGNRNLKTSILTTENIDDEYDYIIVGAGSAGSVVASRLSEDDDKKILLLEAGGHYEENPDLHVPLKWLKLQGTEYDWGYFTEPQNFSCFGMNERRAFWPRGRVLGGSGLLNAMMYTRGSKFDFDGWAKNGCTGWSYKEVLPYFLKSEDIQIEELKSSPYHASGGPMPVSGCRITPLADLYMKAGEELGYKVVDYNGKDQEGFSRIQTNVRNGVRGTSVEFLRKTAGRKNLHIAIRSHVTKVKIENKSATGVYVIRNSRKFLVRAKKEIIISAGVINTPQILILSGIGPKHHLNELGIDVIADLPVGENLQDHIMLWMLTKINASYSVTGKLAESLLTKIKYNVFGIGPLSYSGSDGNAHFYTDGTQKGKTYADIQMIFISKLADKNFFNLRKDIAIEYLADNHNEEGFNTAVILAHPKSKGRVKLKNDDPFEYPVLDPQYLTDKSDTETLIAGLKIWEKLMDTPTFKSLGVSIEQSKLSFCSQHKFRSDAYWKCYIRHLAVTVWHQCCTARMGNKNDPAAVLDPQLRVKGIKGLRVVDASVFPNITSGNTNAPTVMVAEKAADMILGKDSATKSKI